MTAMGGDSDDGGRAGPILVIEEEIVRLSSARKEIREALATARSAEDEVRHVIEALSDAESWRLHGRGRIADMVRAGAVEEIRVAARLAQRHLLRFELELDEVPGIAGQPDAEQLTLLLDRSFDRLLADLLAGDPPAKARTRLDLALRSLGAVRRILLRRDREHETRIAGLAAERRRRLEGS